MRLYQRNPSNRFAMRKRIIRVALLLILVGALSSQGHHIGFLTVNIIVGTSIFRKTLYWLAGWASVIGALDWLHRPFPDAAVYSIGVLIIAALVAIGRHSKGFIWLMDDEAQKPTVGEATRLYAAAFFLAMSGLALRDAPVAKVTCWIAICLALAGWWPQFSMATAFRNIALNSLLLATSTTIAIGSCEIAIRLLLPPLAPAHSDYRMGDAELGFRNTPNAVATIPLERYGTTYDAPDQKQSFVVSVSSQGFRDSEIGPKVEGEFRVLMLGDSFTFGYGVENDETIPNALERKLQLFLFGRKVSVINGGVEGYGPWQARILLHRSGFALDPDLIILQTFTNNDVYDSLAQVGAVFRSYYPGVVDRERALRSQTRFHVRLQRWLRTHSRLYQYLVRATSQENLLADLMEKLRFVPRMPGNVIPPPEPRNPEIETELVDYYPEIDRGWRLFREDIRAISEACRRRDIPLLAYTIPGMHMLYDPYWELYCEPAGTSTIYERGKTLRIMEGIFEELAIPHVDVASALAESGDPLALYFRFNKHLTPQGCDVIATRLANRILSDKLH